MSATAQDLDRLLVEAAVELRHDPLAFVRFAFPGCEPHAWQADLLMGIGERLRVGVQTQYEAIREAVASGHGVGKSTLVAWLILWAMATEVDTKGVITANTETQLKTKTWAELAKWFRTFRFAHWFTLTATALYAADPKREKTWRVDMVPWSERNTEAFAGLHNQGRRILLVFDEASAIPDNIWEVSEGALTDEGTEIIWAAFGNPTRNTGRFRECFGRFRHRWSIRKIDSRDVPGTNKTVIDQWIQDYGEDSDFVKVRVRGEFPLQSANQFISSGDVAAARSYVAEGFESLPKLLVCDVARFGDDQTVIGLRQGRTFRILGKYRGIDTMQVAARILEADKAENADYIIVDGVGVGAGVVDRLRLSLGHKVIEFNGGSRAEDDATYANARAETWGRMRAALRAGFDLPADDELESQLVAVEYGFTAKQQILLEKKETMKARGLESPDVADCLAMSFAIQPADTSVNWGKVQGAGAGVYAW